jgi:hypothetical protein
MNRKNWHYAIELAFYKKKTFVGKFCSNYSVLSCLSFPDSPI